MQLEMEMGFRSSFNFVPEGDYRVPSALRQELLQNGFEIGVHDLRHDGRLFRSAAEFRKRAVRINRYLEDWKAVGFRSGFMLHNLDWLHQLNIEYDMSTFDTDPFEPQPEGRHTIFPNWIPRFPMPRNSSDGAVELTRCLSFEWFRERVCRIALHTPSGFHTLRPSPRALHRSLDQKGRLDRSA